VPPESSRVVGLVVGGAFTQKMLAYVGAQLIGAIVAAQVLYWIAAEAGFSLVAASRQRLRHALPRRICARRVRLAEIVLTFMFLMIILGATDRRVPQGFAPIALALG